MKFFSSHKRPVHLGPLPLERLPRVAHPVPAGLTPARTNPSRPTSTGFAGIVRAYLDAFLACDEIPVASERVPLPDDPLAITNEMKSACYFLDASLVGVCELKPAQDSPDGAGERFAIVLLIEHGRQPESDNFAAAWVGGTADECAALRGVEVATVIAGYIKQLGYSAHVHVHGRSAVDIEELARCAGLVERNGGRHRAPFIGGRFAIAAVVTSLPLQPDRPLATSGALRRGMVRLYHWLGIGGTRSELERRLQQRRLSHLGPYPMERIRRRDTPTTAIFKDEVPRVPQRASFFSRAGRGDLGSRTQRERYRFATKHPLAYAMSPLDRALTSLQDGDVAAATPSHPTDAADNARAVKSLAYYLNADMIGICEAEAYAWYSHDPDGRPIQPHHEYAIVLLIDQGHDTVEGASGDDWISGTQSMRAYLRGAEIAGLIAAQIRSLGYSARAQTHKDSEVLQLPLLLLAGLGELSRIGELVLNPFLGPRSKSVVITTDMPLEIDRPIDFGLQDTCSKCRKCARECPCNAISYKNKVVFNGYEMWKPDVERCTRYRVTNPKGSSCGRCMKVCPFANEGLLSQRFFLWAAIHLPFTRRWIARLDDRVGHGDRNPIKKWWSDLERLDDGTVRAAKGAHARGLNLTKSTTIQKTQEIAYYPASVMPRPDEAGPCPIDRAAALRIAESMETPAEALERRQRGGPPPSHSSPQGNGT